MAQPNDPLDPKGLIRESYQIEGIGPEECRSIFLDWALSVPLDGDTDALRDQLLTRYGDDFPDHPMTAVLREGLGETARPRRRGGWRARDRG